MYVLLCWVEQFFIREINHFTVSAPQCLLTLLPVHRLRRTFLVASWAGFADWGSGERVLGFEQTVRISRIHVEVMIATSWLFALRYIVAN